MTKKIRFTFKLPYGGNAKATAIPALDDGIITFDFPSIVHENVEVAPFLNKLDNIPDFWDELQGTARRRYDQLKLKNNSKITSISPAP